LNQIDKLVEKLKLDLGIREISWDMDSSPLPSFEFDNQKYFLGKSSIFMYDCERQKNVCYLCGDVVKFYPVTEILMGNSAKMHFDYWCQNCEPREMKRVVFLGFD
jgi:hypothetical protein